MKPHLLLVALCLGSCADGLSVDETQREITGPPNTGGFIKGFARIQVGGVFHSGLVVGSNLIFVHPGWAQGVDPTTMSITQFAPDGSISVSTQGRFLNILRDDGAVIQTVDPMSFIGLPIDAHPSTMHTLTCIGFGFTPAGRALEIDAQMDVTGTASNGDLDVTGNTSASTLSPGDIGVPCIDPDPDVKKAVGFVVVSKEGTIRVRPYAAFQPYIDNMKTLAAARGPGKQGVYIKTEVQYLGTPPRRINMCLDVDNASLDPALVNYYPCHGGPNQLWWVDTSVDPAHPRFVSDVSGLCLDVPNGSPMSGQDLEQFGCNGGSNQHFSLSFWPLQHSVTNTVQRMSPLSAPSLCVSVDAWSYNATRPVEQRTCILPNGSYDQRWFFSFNP